MCVNSKIRERGEREMTESNLYLFVAAEPVAPFKAAAVVRRKKSRFSIRRRTRILLYIIMTARRPHRRPSSRALLEFIIFRKYDVYRLGIFQNAVKRIYTCAPYNTHVISSTIILERTFYHIIICFSIVSRRVRITNVIIFFYQRYRATSRDNVIRRNDPRKPVPTHCSSDGRQRQELSHDTIYTSYRRASLNSSDPFPSRVFSSSSIVVDRG